MRDRVEYQQRAEECLRKADAAGTAADRAGWLKLAQDWMTASRISAEMRTHLDVNGSLSIFERTKKSHGYIRER